MGKLVLAAVLAWSIGAMAHPTITISPVPPNAGDTVTITVAGSGVTYPFTVTITPSPGTPFEIPVTGGGGATIVVGPWTKFTATDPAGAATGDGTVVNP